MNSKETNPDEKKNKKLQTAVPKTAKNEVCFLPNLVSTKYDESKTPKKPAVY